MLNEDWFQRELLFVPLDSLPWDTRLALLLREVERIQNERSKEKEVVRPCPYKV